jgi:Zn finger protein HypA/HybF involved in hydrogenase expression
MEQAAPFTSVGRVTAELVATPPSLRCSHCEGELTDDDAQCPRCDSPIDWGASIDALRAWQKATA